MAISEESSHAGYEYNKSMKPSSTIGKRKRNATTKDPAPASALADEAEVDTGYLSPSKPKKRSSGKVKDEEKRLRRYRSHAPGSYLEKLERATTQRMFVIDRSRDDEALEETIEMAGSTGNIYSVKIGLEPSCTCPDNRNGNQCKHIIYVSSQPIVHVYLDKNCSYVCKVLHNVLKAPDHLQYQLAFLSTELQLIFSNAPSSSLAYPASSAPATTESSNRKPIEGDCPICFTPFAPEEEEIVFCRAACGNNIHAECFEQWAKSQAGKEVRCVYCRTPWQGDEEQVRRICRDKTRQGGKSNGEGYVNVAEELGMSGARGRLSSGNFLVCACSTGRDGKVRKGLRLIPVVCDP